MQLEHSVGAGRGGKRLLHPQGSNRASEIWLLPNSLILAQSECAGRPECLCMLLPRPGTWRVGTRTELGVRQASGVFIRWYLS